MYKFIIRPLLFLLSPENIHHLVVYVLRNLQKCNGVSKMIRYFFNYEHIYLEREIWGLKFKNPIGFAAGFDKKAEIFNILGDFGFSHIEVGTITPEAQSGNPKPRLFRVKKDKALINRMGFNNIGIKKTIRNLEKLKPNVIIGINIGKNTSTPNEEAINDYKRCFSELFDYGDYFTINVSCPNVKDLNKLQDKSYLLNLLNELQLINNSKNKRKPILLKISPDLNIEQIDEIIEIVQLTNIDGIVATNTSSQRYNLTTDKQIIENTGNGGLSGLPLRERSTEVISYIAKKTDYKLPIIGVGGIFDYKDAIEKVKAGAWLIQLYTGYIYEGPWVVKQINKELLKNKVYDN
ncbi:MAG: dihydroorotate dehydrogenase (quinone) [Bacteroidetes bacterium GWE2_29_8]|nr:MAG: dihydroorotate dehydrogenase (quinone) [Bacteroidetes bacterium GWE2_29_8]OFY14617.1 MAG: dihydroorotate dehydrogenase (quinone) [Bacteroidetes bacterium GWF2_29_10]